MSEDTPVVVVDVELESGILPFGRPLDMCATQRIRLRHRCFGVQPRDTYYDLTITPNGLRIEKSLGEQKKVRE